MQRAHQPRRRSQRLSDYYPTSKGSPAIREMSNRTKAAVDRFLCVSRLKRCVLSVAAISLLSSCLAPNCLRHEYNRNIPADTESSEESKNLPSKSVPNPKADRYFLGIAISGGGSRAAVLGAGVLMQLNDLGILNKTTTISSVSGGSLPAPYFVLAKAGKLGGCRHDDPTVTAGDCKQLLTETNLRDTFGQNFQIPLLERDVFYSIVKLGPFNTWNRTDAAGEIFGARLFTDEKGHEARFADLPAPPSTQIIINASDEVRGGQPFTFTRETFQHLCSNLGTVKIGAAVAASAAFPFLLRSVAYHDYGPPTDSVRCETPSKSVQQRYTNLFDGGATDNLGVYALDSAYKSWKKANPNSANCLIVVIDSYEPLPDIKTRAYSDDLRGTLDGVLDFTSLDMSTSILLARRRESDLFAIGFPYVQSDDPDDPDLTSIKPKDSFLGASRRTNPKFFPGCNVWHVDLTSWPNDYEETFHTRPEQYRAKATPGTASGVAYHRVYDSRKQPKEPSELDSYSRFKSSVETVPTNFWLSNEQVNDLFLAAYLKVNLQYNKDCLCKLFKQTTRSDCANYQTNPQACAGIYDKPRTPNVLAPAD